MWSHISTRSLYDDLDFVYHEVYSTYFEILHAFNRSIAISRWRNTFLQISLAKIAVLYLEHGTHIIPLPSLFNANKRFTFSRFMKTSQNIP